MATADDDDPRSWRKELRAALIAQRRAIAPADRHQWNAAIAERLSPLLFSLPAGTIGFYWPLAGEFDPRPIVRELVKRGWQAALPAVVAPRQPLEFRPWREGMALENGVWDIPVPPAGAVAKPDTLLVPVVGFDLARYRLGYGGGFFDRTLAAVDPRPLAIGIGYELSRVPTIRPQAHDIPMGAIVTEADVLR